MLHIEKGQCGLCAHFGETHNGHEDRLAQIRLKTGSGEARGRVRPSPARIFAPQSNPDQRLRRLRAGQTS